MAHIRVHPPGTAAVDRHVRVLSRQHNGQRIDERFADLVTLRRAAKTGLFLGAGALFDGVHIGGCESVNVRDTLRGVKLLLYGPVVIVRLAAGGRNIYDPGARVSGCSREEGLAHVSRALVVNVNDLLGFLRIFFVVLVDAGIINKDVDVFGTAEERLNRRLVANIEFGVLDCVWWRDLDP